MLHRYSQFGHGRQPLEEPLGQGGEVVAAQAPFCAEGRRRAEERREVSHESRLLTVSYYLPGIAIPPRGTDHIRMRQENRGGFAAP